MITQALFDVVLGIIGKFVDSLMSQMDLPVGAHLDIPSPFFFLFYDTFKLVYQIYPILFAFYVWRQIKA